MDLKLYALFTVLHFRTDYIIFEMLSGQSRLIFDTFTSPRTGVTNKFFVYSLTLCRQKGVLLYIYSQIKRFISQH